MPPSDESMTIQAFYIAHRPDHLSLRKNWLACARQTRRCTRLGRVAFNPAFISVLTPSSIPIIFATDVYTELHR